MPAQKPVTYKDAGVDIEAGNALVDRIRPLARSTRRSGVMGGIGGFGGLFELDLERYRQPVLVAGTDGVGTKLKLAIQLERYDTIGIDLVAMSANDVIVHGAEPLFFLDYFATARLDLAIGEAVVAGIADGCRQAGAALLGGETAEMPGLYQARDFDLAGFCVGVTEKDKLIDGSAARPGDRLLGLASSGPHSNGYSLIRRVLDTAPEGLATMLDGSTVGERLLAPTRIYVRAILELLERCEIGAIAHITGGGLAENLQRVLPGDVDARIAGDWPRPEIFDWLQQQGRIADDEMLRTFNCGVGLVIAVPAHQAKPAMAALQASGEQVLELGELVAGSGDVRIGA